MLGVTVVFGFFEHISFGAKFVSKNIDFLLLVCRFVALGVVLLSKEKFQLNASRLAIF